MLRIITAAEALGQSRLVLGMAGMTPVSDVATIRHPWNLPTPTT